MFQALSLGSVAFVGFPDHGASGLQHRPKQTRVGKLPVPKLSLALSTQCPQGVGGAKGAKKSRGKGWIRPSSEDLPGAPAADLTKSPPAPIAAAPLPNRNNGSSSSNFIIELDGKCHTRLLNMSCSGDFLANSAHPSDLDEGCGDAQCSWQKHVLATT